MKLLVLAFLALTAVPALAAPSPVILHSIKNGKIVKKRGLKKLLVNCPKNNRLIRTIYTDFARAAQSSFNKYGAPKRITFQSQILKNGTLLITSNRSVKIAAGPYKGKKQRMRIEMQPKSECSIARTL